MIAMDDAAGDAAAPDASQASEFVLIEGVEVAPFTTVVDRLRSVYPHVPPARIESILLREWEAFTAGRPLVVPIAVEEGVREILDRR